MRKLLWMAAIPLLASACTVGPDYKRPVTPSPEKYYAQPAAQADSLADIAWWDLFKDPVLQGLIQESLKNGFDARLAVARVQEAAAQAGVTNSLKYPQVGYGGNITGQKLPVEQVPSALYLGINATLSWELDLWGRIRRLNEQQQALFLGSQEAQRGVWLSLVSNVAQAYFELRALDAQLEIARLTTRSFQDTYDLFSRKLAGGAATALETSRAEGALANVSAQIPDIERQIVAKENEINLLLGRVPAPIARGGTLASQYDPNTIPAGLPSTLLERRPDVRQSEQQLVAFNAAIGVAKANYFPVISLTGLLGGVSAQLSNTVSGGFLWALGGNAVGPLYTAGRLKNQYNVAVAQRDQAQIFYEQSVTQAFGEVSTALSAHEKLAQSVTQQMRSVSAYTEAVRLANLRYDQGLSSYFEVVDAMLQLYPAQQFLVQFDLQRKIALVQLYKALGGGWKMTDTDWLKTTTAPKP